MKQVAKQRLKYSGACGYQWMNLALAMRKFMISLSSNIDV
jgi:hypothetical protein